MPSQGQRPEAIQWEQLPAQTPRAPEGDWNGAYRSVRARAQLPGLMYREGGRFLSSETSHRRGTWETGLLGKVSQWRGTRPPLPVTSQGLVGGPDG